ncbi:Universal stress protein [Frankliniella fusca]|uniref:Universal stress protein n=1 Tax=Frankliniella fusca TaxID=407009 RepID=A0AAE1GQL2_9NEOP|nr:Universal stress protein [Frankliniella fusca]
MRPLFDPPPMCRAISKKPQIVVHISFLYELILSCGTEFCVTFYWLAKGCLSLNSSWPRQSQVLSVSGLCESCNTSHQYGDARRAAPGFGPDPGPGGAAPASGSQLGAGVEEEARQIALILSVTNAHDGRNKHLREKLMVIPPSPPPVTGRPAPPPAARPFDCFDAVPRCRPQCRPQCRPHGGSGSSASSAARRQGLPPRPQDADVEGDRAFRPGLDRVPPSLGRDATFLQQIASDPSEYSFDQKYVKEQLNNDSRKYEDGIDSELFSSAELQGLPVSGMAEEAVRYLKARQVFWQRRGPIAPPTRKPRRRGAEALSPRDPRRADDMQQTT